ncbi:MAG: hypothetical protein IJ019_02630 [Alphaproteobacteria bacterium]|nr:hypothetical protein [Alphaproteobacteria bacterium]
MKKIKVAYQGIKGAYSYLAAENVFKNAEIIGLETFEEVFESVEQGIYDIAFIPVKNSFAGIVKETAPYLAATKLVKTGVYEFRIHHQLWGLKDSKLSEIEKVYSHPQALAQCRLFWQQHHFEPKEYIDTALSCKKILELGDKKSAAIASDSAGLIYGLKKLAENIESMNDNITTFYILCREDKFNFKNIDNFIKKSLTD